MVFAAFSAPAQPEGLVDLNTAGEEELQRLPGIGPGLARRIIDDREANGPFKEPGELTRVFGIGDVRYRRLQDLVMTSRVEAPLSRPAPIDRVNLNTATQAELENLPGIGPVRARRIIDYREQEGGFKKTEDLVRVYGIGEKTYESLKNRVTVYGEALEKVVTPAVFLPQPPVPEI